MSGLPTRSAAGERVTAKAKRPGDRLASVVIVNDFAFVNGGQSKVALDSARLLANAGLKVSFFAAVGPADSQLSASGISVHCLDQQDILSDPNRGRAAIRGLWNAPAARALRAPLDCFDPARTVLHCHGFAKALSPAIGPLLTRGPVPSVYTMHEYFLACPNGGFYDYRKNRICTRRAMSRSCLAADCDARRPAHKAWRVARQATLRLLDGMPDRLRDIIYISQIQKQVMQPYLAPGTRLHHVPNPPDCDRQAARCGRSQRFVSLHRPTEPREGRAVVLRSGMAGVTAAVIGDGPERAPMQAANPGNMFTGWLPFEDVQRWIARARCVVFPSLWYETFGLSAYEALQRGIPVIAGRWTAASEAVKHEVFGLLVAEPTARGFAEAMSALQNPRHPVFRRIHAARPQAISEQDHLERLLATYATILGEAPTQPERVATSPATGRSIAAGTE